MFLKKHLPFVWDKQIFTHENLNYTQKKLFPGKVTIFHTKTFLHTSLSDFHTKTVFNIRKTYFHIKF